MILAIESRDRQFLIEKIFYNIQFKDPHQNLAEKKPKIIETKNNYKVNRHVCQSPFWALLKTFTFIRSR